MPAEYWPCWPSPASCPQTFNPITTKFQTHKTLPKIQGYPIAFSALPIPFEEFIASIEGLQLYQSPHHVLKLHQSFPAAQCLPDPPVCCPSCVHSHGWSSFGVNLILWGKALIPTSPFSSASTVSNTSTALVSLLLDLHPQLQ